MSLRWLVFLAMALVLVQGSQVHPPAADNTCSVSKDEKSFLSTLLTVTGFTETCVAAALDVCESGGQKDSGYASLMQETREVVQQVSAAVNTWEVQVSAALSTWESRLNAALNTWESRPRHCKDLLDSGDSGRGVRQVYPYPGQPHHRVSVFCDQTIDGGGWTLFQRRTNDSERENFFRSWFEYKMGFGNLQTEFWAGLDLLHQLTSTSLQQLRIDLDDYEGEHRFAKYALFHVAGPDTNYLLTVRNYSGDAGNSLIPWHNGQPFTTHDRDNDNWDNGNCAERYKGGWWYGGCGLSNLNGYQHVGSGSPSYEGIMWFSWRGVKYSLKRVSMMTRPSV